jgi:hypothetical protein
VDRSGPDCHGLSDIDAIIAAAQQGEYYCPDSPEDGVESEDNFVSGNPKCLGGTGRNDVPEGAGDPNGGRSLPYSLAGSTAELDFVRSILAYQTGTQPRSVSDLSASSLAPLLRGRQVMLR